MTAPDFLPSLAPLPWRSGDKAMGEAEHIVRDNIGKVVGSFRHHPDTSFSQDGTLAAFVCAAVNAHEEATTLLKLAHPYLLALADDDQGADSLLDRLETFLKEHA